MTALPIRPHLLTLRQVSVIIQVHERTVRRYIDEGKLSGHNPNGDAKGLRIPVESVRAYLRMYLLDDFSDDAFDYQIDALGRDLSRPGRRILSRWV